MVSGKSLLVRAEMETFVWICILDLLIELYNPKFSTKSGFYAMIHVKDLRAYFNPFMRKVCKDLC